MITGLTRAYVGVAVFAIGAVLSLPSLARAEVPEHLRGKWVEVGHPANWIQFEDGRNVGGENWEGDWKGHFHFGGHERGKYHFHKEDAHDGKLKLRDRAGVEVAEGQIHHEGDKHHLRFEGHEYRRE
jgi:hypothetical protein